MNSFFSLFSELNLPSSQFSSHGICSDLTYDFGCYANILYFEKVFCSLKQDKDFKSTCYKIKYSKYFESSNETTFIEDYSFLAKK